MFNRNREESPRGIELNPHPPRPARLSRKAMIVICAIGFALVMLLGYGMVQRSKAQAQQAAKTVEKQVKPASADELHKSWIKEAQQAAPSAPQLPEAPPPLSEDNPKAPSERLIVRQMPPPVAAPPQHGGYNAPPKQTPQELQREAEQKWEQEAIASSTVIQASATLGVAPSIPQALANSMQTLMPGQTTAPVTPANLPESAEPAAAKLAFLESERKKLPEHYLRALRTQPVSPYEIKAGWEIPAILEQALNSDLPGEIKALVRNNVYDTATGRYLLIPQGSRLVGIYNSRVDYGQDGLQVIWNRLIYPDASSLDLGGMNGMDAKGYSGLRHDVDNHYKRIFGMAALTSAFAAALALSQRQNQSMLTYPSPNEVAGAAVVREMSMTGQMLTRRNLMIPPTIKVPLGYTFTVRVNKDILFEEPYHPQNTAPPTTNRSLMPVAMAPVSNDAGR